eukprot:COSAG02_NODE_3809_length_6200_cov_16.371415_6_plen_228_part_00
MRGQGRRWCSKGRLGLHAPRAWRPCYMVLRDRSRMRASRVRDQCVDLQRWRCHEQTVARTMQWLAAARGIVVVSTIVAERSVSGGRRSLPPSRRVQFAKVEQTGRRSAPDLSSRQDSKHALRPEQALLQTLCAVGLSQGGGPAAAVQLVEVRTVPWCRMEGSGLLSGCARWVQVYSNVPRRAAPYWLLPARIKGRGAPAASDRRLVLRSPERVRNLLRAVHRRDDAN